MSSENEADRVYDFVLSIAINHCEGPQIFNRNTEVGGEQCGRRWDKELKKVTGNLPDSDQ